MLGRGWTGMAGMMQGGVKVQRGAFGLYEGPFQVSFCDYNGET